MAESDIIKRVKSMRGQAPAILMAEFCKARLDERMHGLLSCSKETFEVHKGRCQELQSLIQFFEGRDNT